MNKFVFIGIIALILGTAGVLVASGDKNVTTTANTSSQAATSEQQAQIDKILAQYTGSGGTYNDYSVADLATVPEGDKSVLFFEGRNCPSCKQLDKNILSSDVPDGVHIFNILYEDNLDLAQKYQVRGTPGLYQVDSQGNVLRQLQPVIRLDDILLQLI